MSFTKLNPPKPLLGRRVIKTHDEEREVRKMKLNVKKVECVATTCESDAPPWKETKTQCL